MADIRTGILMSLVSLLLMFGPASAVVNGQLSREVREKFEAILLDLDQDIRIEFEKAIANDSPVVELTPQQFRKFRNNPVNPFDISDIDPDDLDGNIELRFELPSIRNRPVQPFERQSRSLRRRLRPVVAEVASSVVKITDGTDQIALGTVVRSDGLILTKASEILNRSAIYCDVGLQGTHEATIVEMDQRNDLALLRINQRNLPAISWSDSQPLNGSFVVTPDPEGGVISLGAYSVVARSTIGEGLLGVVPQTASEGVVIAEPVEPDTAAYQAGLARGDVIVSIDGVQILDVQQLVNEIRKRHAGDQIHIGFIRNGAARFAKAKLARNELTGMRAARFKMMSRLGAVPSERDSNFPVVFQHDSELFPEQCGGPICDLHGNVLGINISRESRAASYAIPANHVKTILERILD